MSTFVETCIEKIFPAKSQYDFADISSNQCSWCSYEFVSRLKRLVALAWSTGKESELASVHTEAVLAASEKRKEFGTVPYGENIDNITLQHQYQEKVTIVHSLLCTENEDLYFPIDEGYEKEFMSKERCNTVSREEMYKSFCSWLSVGHNRFALANRSGQSFAILRVSPEKVLICDSHCRAFGITSFEKAFKYIMFDQPEKSYKFCMLLLGYTL